MNFRTLALVGLLCVGMVYGEDGSSNAASSNSLDKSNKSLIPAEQDDTLTRLQAAKKLQIPLPLTTPYDSDPKKRDVYLEEYQSAYRSILAAVDIGCHMGVKGVTFLAYQDGWTAGIKAARKDHPEKWAEMLGVPLDCILQWEKNQSEHPSTTPQ
jgi:hypothetical protein